MNRTQKYWTIVRTLVTRCLHRRLISTIAQTIVDFDWAASKDRVKQVDPSTLCLDDVKLSVPPGAFGETPLQDLAAICALARKQRPALVFEFGTFTGNTILNLAMNVPDDTRLLTVDLGEEHRADLDEHRWEKTFDQMVVGHRYRDTKYEPRITQIYSDTRKFDHLPYKGGCDFIFIDACHEYDFVVNDTGKALEMIAPGGVIAWHDYKQEFPGVWRHVEELAAKRGLDVAWVEGTNVAFCQCPS